MKRGNDIATRINMPGIEIYGAYHGFCCIFAFLTSAKNQLPSRKAAMSTGIYLMTSKKDDTETESFL